MARKTRVIPSGFGVLHILIYDLPICFDTVSEKTNRQHDAFGIELRKASESLALRKIGCSDSVTRPTWCRLALGNITNPNLKKSATDFTNYHGRFA